MPCDSCRKVSGFCRELVNDMLIHPGLMPVPRVVRICIIKQKPRRLCGLECPAQETGCVGIAGHPLL